MQQQRFYQKILSKIIESIKNYYSVFVKKKFEKFENMIRFKKIIFYISTSLYYGLLIGIGLFSILSVCSILLSTINKISIIIFLFVIFLAYLGSIKNLLLEKDIFSKILILIFIFSSTLFAILIYLWLTEAIIERNYPMSIEMIGCKLFLKRYFLINKDIF